MASARPSALARAFAAVVLLVGVAACGGSPGGSGPAGGSGQFGAAPLTSPPVASSSSADPTGEPAFTFSPSPSASRPDSQGSGDLRASYHVDKALLGAKSTVTITLSNAGDGVVNGWTVIMGLSGVTLTVTTPPQIKHEVRDGEHVFTPNGAGDVLGAGDTLSFTFTATGLGSVSSCTANGRDCTST